MVVASTAPDADKTIHPVDSYVAQQIRKARRARGISQKKLGEMCSAPITFQQVQKYERTINRVTIGRLWDIAAALELPFEYFLPEHNFNAAPLIDERQARLLVRFNKFKPSLQIALLKMIEAMPDGGSQ